MRKKLIFLSFLAFLIGFPLVFFLWWKRAILPVAPKSKEAQIVVIPQGWGSSDIVKELKRQGLIKSGVAFHLMVIKEGLSNKLQAGDFRLSPSMNLFEISQALSHGTLDIWVVIPEGLRKEEIGRLIKKEFLKQEADFDLENFLEETQDLEGYLFPDTYLLPKEASASSIIRILRGTFEQKYNSLAVKTSLTKAQLVTLASLVEREAKEDEDRRLVAGILLKRLKKGWPLQVDATAQYIKANQQCQPLAKDCQWWPKIAAEDLKIDSLYNTYENRGLPPTPICNPGLASLQAAADPQETDYWFYLSDDSGKIHYTETLEEHEENINKFIMVDN
jgi:UPF0755 protein